MSHTLFNPTDIIQKVSSFALVLDFFFYGTVKILCFLASKNGGKAPLSYQSFLKIAGEPSCAESELLMSYSSLPPIGDVGSIGVSEVPTLEELGYREDEQVKR